MKKFAILIFITSMLAVYAHNNAQSAGERIFSSKEKKLLKKGSPMTFVYMKWKGSSNSNMEDVSDFLNISALPWGWDGYDVVMVEKAYLRVKVTGSSRLMMFNTMASHAGLKGMFYYSITDAGVKRLILESFSVKSCGDRAYIADETVSVIKARSESSFVIRDNRLGLICFNGAVEYRDGIFIETDVSCGKVSRMGMTVFDDGGYVIKHFVVPDDSGEGYYYCSVQIMKVESSIIKDLNLLNARNFGNRIRGETVHFFSRMGYDISSNIAAFR